MAAIIKTPGTKSQKINQKKDLEKFAVPGRYPNKATEELYGVWKGKDISIEKNREKNNQNKWAQPHASRRQITSAINI